MFVLAVGDFEAVGVGVGDDEDDEVEITSGVDVLEFAFDSIDQQLAPSTPIATSPNNL